MKYFWGDDWVSRVFVLLRCSNVRGVCLLTDGRWRRVSKANGLLPSPSSSTANFVVKRTKAAPSNPRHTHAHSPPPPPFDCQRNCLAPSHKPSLSEVFAKPIGEKGVFTFFPSLSLLQSSKPDSHKMSTQRRLFAKSLAMVWSKIKLPNQLQKGSAVRAGAHSDSIQDMSHFFIFLESRNTLNKSPFTPARKWHFCDCNLTDQG